MAFNIVKEIAEIEDTRSDDNVIRVSIVEMGGRTKTLALDIRSMWWPEDADDFVPTKKGVTFRSLEEAKILLSAVKVAVDEMEALEAAAGKAAPKRRPGSPSRATGKVVKTKP